MGFQTIRLRDRAFGRNVLDFQASDVSGWLPEEAPLAMPRQDLKAPYESIKAMETAPRAMWERRTLVFGATFLLTFFACLAPFIQSGRHGWDKLEIAAFTIFAVLTVSIACWFCNAAAGLIVLLKGREQDDLDFAPHPPKPSTRTALLAPVYNEDIRAVFERLAGMDAALARLGVSDVFDIFVLSDSTKPHAIAAERTAFQNFRLQTVSETFYRRREQNTEHKSGNIADWVRRFGGAYECMIVLDADSTMAGETLLRLVDAMERNPSIGLIQTAPTIIGAQTLYARISQFGVRLYGRVAAAGLAWWTGAEGSYWGHNAILRTRAFAECCGLPILEGEKPFGGPVLSHDVVEAALLRRAGWGVHVTAALDGSCEETPPTITDFIRRDHRWCQGNLQHLGLIRAQGLSPISRLQLAMGCMAYLSSPIWLASLVAGLIIQLQHPTDWGSMWNFVHPEVTPYMLASMLAGLLLIGPKFMGCALVLSRRGERRAYGGSLAVIKSMLCEVFFSTILAPILMIANTRAVFLILRGADAGWHAQERDADGLSWPDAFRSMQWQMVAGVAFTIALGWRMDLAACFAPIVMPLLLAPALAVFTSRRSNGDSLAAAGFLVIPDDNQTTAMPAVIPAALRPTPVFEGELAVARL